MSNSNNFQIENTHPKDMQNDHVIGIVLIYILYNAFKLYFCGYFIVGIEVQTYLCTQIFNGTVL
jgi:hypothetical protein